MTMLFGLCATLTSALSNVALTGGLVAAVAAGLACDVAIRQAID